MDGVQWASLPTLLLPAERVVSAQLPAMGTIYYAIQPEAVITGAEQMQLTLIGN